VQKSLMPKGVDHSTCTYPNYLQVIVQKSLMPKGVDHGLGTGLDHATLFVQKSLMPKGVDHLPKAKIGNGCVVCKNL